LNLPLNTCCRVLTRRTPNISNRVRNPRSRNRLTLSLQQVPWGTSWSRVEYKTSLVTYLTLWRHPEALS